MSSARGLTGRDEAPFPAVRSNHSASSRGNRLTGDTLVGTMRRRGAESPSLVACAGGVRRPQATDPLRQSRSNSAGSYLEILAGSRYRSQAEAAASNPARDRKSTRLNSSHGSISYAVFCLKQKKKTDTINRTQIQ